MADLDSVSIQGRFGLTVIDGTDPGDEPDVIWCDQGRALLTPKQTWTKVPGGTPVPFSSGQAQFPLPVDNEGYVTNQGIRIIKVVDLTSPKVNPQIPDGAATHTLSFDGMMAGGTPVPFPTVSVRLAADMVDPETGLIDLTLAAAFPSDGGGTPIVIGPRGTGLTGVVVQPTADTVEFELSNGETTDPITLPVGPGGSDAGVAGYIATPGSQTQTALSAQMLERAAAISAKGLGWRIVTDPAWGGISAGDIANAFDAAHAAIVAAGGIGTIYIPPGEWKLSRTVSVDARRVNVVGANSSITFTATSGVMFQIYGSQGGTAVQTGPVLSGLRLNGPGKATSTTAVKMNTDDALTTLSYVACHPIEACRISEFGVGVRYAHRAWGNTLKSSMLERCGVGFLVPTGMDSSMGERLAFEDCLLAENDIAVDVRSGSVETVFLNTSFDYNAVASKTMRNEHYIGCHVETNASKWDGSVGHFQHTADTAYTHFSDTTFVLGATGQGITSEPFEPYNTATLSDHYGRRDRFVFTDTRWSLIWGTFVSRMANFPHKRLVNEISGNRNIRRGIFTGLHIASSPGPIFGGSLVAGRSMSGVALPAAEASVGGGDAVTSSSTLDDLSGSNPLSARTYVAPATAAGANTLTVKIKIPVGPEDYGKRLLVAQKADLTITGSDSQRTVYARAFTRDGVELSTFESWAGQTTMPAGTSTKVELWPDGYAYDVVPTGTGYVEIQMAFSKIRNGDSWKLYAPLVNIV